jgi:IS5 family transposase
MRHFAGLELNRLLDETTILKFRHFMEYHGLGKVLFKEANKHLKKNGLIQGTDTTAANDHDIVPTVNFLHGDDQRAFGDADYLGVQKQDEHKDRKKVSWFISKRRGTRKNLGERKLRAEEPKGIARAKLEHLLRYAKQVFGHSKVRYRGLAKNTSRPHLMAASSNLLICEKIRWRRASASGFGQNLGKRAENE